jgi:hypothetical protein
MKATEIIDKVKEILSISQASGEKVELKEVEEIEVKEVVELSEEVVETKEVTEEVELAEDVAEAPTEEATAPQVMVEAASKDDLVALKTEILDLIADLMKEKESNKDVPKELSAVELKEEEVSEISHSPESEVEVKFKHKYAQNRPQGIKDKVYSKLFNN